MVSQIASQKNIILKMSEANIENWDSKGGALTKIALRQNESDSHNAILLETPKWGFYKTENHLSEVSDFDYVFISDCHNIRFSQPICLLKR